MPGAVLMTGVGGPVVAMPDVNVVVSNTSPTTSNASITLNSTGGWTTTDAQSGNWLAGSNNGAAYDVRATLNSGSAGGSGFGTWLQLNANRSWSQGQVAVGSTTSNITLEIRPTGGGANLDTATIDLTATVT